MSRVHGLEPDATLAGPLETDGARPLTTGAVPAGEGSVDATVGEKVTLAHDVDAVRRLDAEFGARIRRNELGAPGGRDAARAGVSAGRDDATRRLLETVLQGEEAYVASLSTRIELARRQASLIRHALTRPSHLRHRAN